MRGVRKERIRPERSGAPAPRFTNSGGAAAERTQRTAHALPHSPRGQELLRRRMGSTQEGGGVTAGHGYARQTRRERGD